MQNGELGIVEADPLKIHDLCGELSKRKLSLCAISEHRWKGEGTYQVDPEWMFLFSGLENPVKASQGVGFLLNRKMVRAWKKADELCEYGAGRLIRIWLCIRGRFFSVTSCYAPTFQCSEEEKEMFYINLGAMMDRVHPKDELIVLGDFNARVGVREEAGGNSDQMTIREAVGRHGLPELNENGVRLLDFCSNRPRDSPITASTCFQHEAYGTWYHPSSRKYFQIDHILCRRRTLGVISDVKVMIGYIHRTDHRCVKLCLSVPRKSSLGRRFGNGTTGAGDVRTSRLNVQLLADQDKSNLLNSKLHELLADGLFDDGYELFGRGIRRVAHSLLGVLCPMLACQNGNESIRANCSNLVNAK